MIREFKLSNVRLNPSFLIIGKRGCGKTKIAIDILKHFSSIPDGIIISSELDPRYKEFTNRKIYYDYNTKILSDFVHERIKKKEDEKNGLINDSRGIIIIDNCVSLKFFQDPVFVDMVHNSGQLGITYVLTIGYPFGFVVGIKHNIDYVMLLNEDYVSNIKKRYEHYGGFISNFGHFKEIHYKLTQDYGTMVILNTEKRRGEDRIKLYRKTVKNYDVL